MNWWTTATEAQKLAQIDAGIELGMTSAQIAMASRTTAAAIRGFAGTRGREFPLKAGTGSQRRMGRSRHDRAAYLRGDRMALWGNTEPQDDFILDEASS